MHARVSILTKFLGPTNHRGPRVVARTSDDRCKVTVEWIHEMSPLDNHAAAAMACARRCGWLDGAYPTAEWHAGHTRDGYVFVWVVDGETFAFKGATAPGGQ